VLAADYRLDAVGYRLMVLAGYCTDLASVPRLLWRFAPPAEPDTCAPALIHDCLYQTAQYPRAVCDDLFYRLLLANGECRAKAYTLWLGVRAGGWVAYGGRGKHEHAVQHFACEKLDGV